MLANTPKTVESGYDTAQFMAGYHLHISTSLDDFPDRHPECFINSDPLGPPVGVVVQNAGLGDWLRRKLADRRGSVMGLDLMMPEQALRTFVLAYPAAENFLKTRNLLFTDGMKIVLYKALVEVRGSREPEYESLRRYMAVQDGADERTWQLAERLAGIFHHYDMNCPPLIRAWSTGRVFELTDPRDRIAEAWQRRLWNRLFYTGSPYTHLSRVLSEVTTSPNPPGGPAAGIVLFGSMFLGETALEFLRHLARHRDVHHVLLLPSRVFAGGGNGPEQLFLQSNSALLTDFPALIERLKPDSLETFPDTARHTSTVLDRLKTSLEHDRPWTGEAGAEPAVQRPPTAIPDDGSLAIHRVTGTLREVEVLKDRILQALAEDSGLAPSQIGVLAPDIGIYAPHIAAVFPGKDRTDDSPHLEFNIADLPPRTDAPYPAAFAALLAIPGSKFARTSMMSLFTNPCFAATGGDEVLVERWRVFIDTLHVRRGMDGAHRRSFGAADTVSGSWESAFSRLLDGYVMDDGDDPDILPAVLDGEDDADAAGRLIHTVRVLHDELWGLSGESRTLKDWTLLWESHVERWLAPRSDGVEGEADRRDRLQVKAAFRNLLALESDLSGLPGFTDGEVPWTVFSSLVSDMARPVERRQGRFLSRGVTCASLKPMRAIPFRRIYVLGLNESDWPGRDRLAGFDLRDRMPKLIDLSRSAVDRFAFLETIFSARDHISFFYTDRDPERGEELAPAAPLAELMEHLGEGVSGLVRRHPLLPFDPAALTGAGPLATSSTEALEQALARRRTPAAAGSVESLSREVDTMSIEWRRLERFLRNPVEHFYRHRLGAALPRDSTAEGDDDILEPGRLEWRNWCSGLLEHDIELLRDPENCVEAFRRRVELDGAVARTAAWKRSIETCLDDARRLAGQIGELDDPGFSEPPFSCRFLAGSVTTNTAGLVDVPAPVVAPPGGGAVRLTGSLNGLRASPKGTGGAERWYLLEYAPRYSGQVRHAIRGWIASLLLGSLPEPLRPVELRVYRLGGKSSSSAGFPVAGTQAGLENLVDLYLESRRNVLPLYPDLADALAVRHRREPVDERLEEEARAAWTALVADTRSAWSAIRDCPWRALFLHEPDFGTDLFRRAWTELYLKGGLL